MQKRTLRRLFLLFALLLVTAALFLAWRAQTPAKRPPPKGATAASQRPALTVTTVSPEATVLPRILVASGDIAAWQEASIGSEANGLRLTEVLVNVGDRVKAGDLLARFSADTVRADLAQARASLMEARANLADASATAERARSLASSGALSARQIDQYQTAEQTARAQLAAAQARLEAQQLRLKFTRLTAPDDGLISFRAATVGAVVPAGTELFRLIRKGRLEWRAEVMASELSRLEPGTPASVTAANGTTLPGKVRSIGPTVDPKTRTALVYVDLGPPPPNAPPARAGMFARGEFVTGSSSALTVPQQAVVLRDGFSYVFRVGADSRVDQQRVKTGRYLQQRVEITEGVRPDDVLVAGGAGFLNEGDLVRVEASAASAGETP